MTPSINLGILSSGARFLFTPPEYQYTNHIYTTGANSSAQTFLSNQGLNGEDAVVRLNETPYVDESQSPTINQYSEFSLSENQDALFPLRDDHIASWTMSIWASRPEVVTDPLFDKASYAFYATDPHPDFSDYMHVGLLSALDSSGRHVVGFAQFNTLIPSNPSFWLPRGPYSASLSFIPQELDRLFQHLVITFDESSLELKFYLNGQLRTTRSGTNIRISQDADIIINSANGQRSVKDARLYQTVLDQAEIEAIYNDGYISPRYD